MYGSRGRGGGPSRATPTNVQCQKCLKRGHYSYECKSSTQERPYVSRPSRSQQLRNPKLVPKLTMETPDAVEKKKGAADEELAKIAAERSKKEAQNNEGYESSGSGQSRPRSVSSHSVSTVSTGSRGRSPSPQRRSRSPQNSEVRRTYRSRSRSISRSASERSASPDNRAIAKEGSNRSPRRSHGRHNNNRQRSNSGDRIGETRHQDQQQRPARNRSLSPFSKRLAMSREAK